MITCAPLVAGNLPIKTLVPRQRSTNIISNINNVGYEADVEHGMMYLTEVGESCDEREESHLVRSLTTCLVPPEVQQRLWIHLPLQHCISLLRESLKAGPSENW